MQEFRRQQCEWVSTEPLEDGIAFSVPLSRASWDSVVLGPDPRALWLSAFSFCSNFYPIIGLQVGIRGRLKERIWIFMKRRRKRTKFLSTGFLELVLGSRKRNNEREENQWELTDQNALGGFEVPASLPSCDHTWALALPVSQFPQLWNANTHPTDQTEFIGWGMWSALWEAQHS